MLSFCNGNNLEKMRYMFSVESFFFFFLMFSVQLSSVYRYSPPIQDTKYKLRICLVERDCYFNEGGGFGCWRFLCTFKL